MHGKAGGAILFKQVLCIWNRDDSQSDEENNNNKRQACKKVNHTDSPSTQPGRYIIRTHYAHSFASRQLQILRFITTAARNKLAKIAKNQKSFSKRPLTFLPIFNVKGFICAVCVISITGSKLFYSIQYCHQNVECWICAMERFQVYSLIA